MTVQSISELVMKHKGKRICVMGGASSLDDDLKRIKADIYISANDHGARRRPVDYMVCMDNIHTRNKREMRHFLREVSDAPIISPWHWGQYQIGKWPDHPCLFNTGIMASWIAYLMGAHPIILAGFDCYGGSSGRIFEMHKQYVKHIKCQVRVVSGPLLKLYPEYDPKEKLGRYKVPPAFDDSIDGQVKVRVNGLFEFRGYQWPIGTIIYVPYHECRLQIKHKTLVLVD